MNRLRSRLLSSVSEAVKPSVSVIVTGKNAAQTLERCLRSIAAQQLCPREIIYVDGGSTDDSAKIARKFTSRVIEGSTKNPAQGRNAGIAFARGDILVFVDADCEIPNSWLSKAAELLLSNEKIGVVGGAYLPDHPAPIPSNDLEFVLASPLISLGSIQHKPKRRQSRVRSIPAGLIAVRRQVIEEVGAFDSDLAYCEDSELCDRIRESGYAVLYDPSLVARHMKHYSLRGLINLGYRYGLGRALALGIHPRLFSVRNLIPVLLLVAGILAFTYPVDSILAKNAVFLLGTYAIGVLGTSGFVSLGEGRLRSTFLVALAHFGIHFSYGFGFLRGIADLAWKRIPILFPIATGIMFVALRQIGALDYYGTITGWDTAHYVYLARFVGDNGILAFLQVQRNSYVLYPLLLEAISVFSGQSPLFVEQFLPIALTVVLFGSMMIFGLRTLHDDLARAAIPFFMILWLALYRIGADLHSNLLSLSLLLIGLAFSTEYVYSLNKFRLVPFVMLLAGLSHPQTAALGFAVLIIALLFSRLAFPTRIISAKRVLTLSASTLAPIVLALVSDPRILGAGVGGGTYPIPWPPDLYGTFVFLLIPIFIVGALQFCTRRARESPQALLVIAWLLVSLLVVLVAFPFSSLREWAYRSLVLIPVPIFLSNGMVVLFRAVWGFGSKLREVSMFRILRVFGTIGLAVLIASGAFLSALQVQDYAGIHMRSFISDEARFALQQLSDTGLVRPDPIFVVYSDDYWTGGFAQLWDNWIGIYFGNHHVYPGRLFYYFRGMQTPFNSSASRGISDLYFSTLASSKLVGINATTSHDIVIVTPFYSALSREELKILTPEGQNAYLVSRNVTTQALLNVPLTLSGFYDKASVEGPWYGISRTWATNDLVLELYMPNASANVFTDSATYQFSAPTKRGYNMTLATFDYETGYQPWSFCVDEICHTIRYSGSLLPMTLSISAILPGGTNQIRVNATGNGPLIINLDYFTITET